jgi:outer membrane protein assembly factor BamA
MGIFSAVSIEATTDTLSDKRKLDVAVSCTLDQPLEASIEVNASSKSNSYIGPGITLGVTNKNIFGGGEQFSVKLNGSYEWQTGSDNKGGIFNSYEFGLTTSLAFPRLLAPKFIPRRRRQINWTRFSLNADLLNRPHFFKMAQFNMAMSYDWQATRRATMSYTPFKLTYTKMINTTAEFDSIMAANPAVALSFENQFIPQMQYSYLYERNYDKNNTLNLSISVQEAGNVFWSIYELAGKKDGQKELFGTPFSQFVKGQLQLVYSRRLEGTNTWIVSRGAVGAAHAYGNSSQVPYAEQFYCGGANSVRAFTVRSIGPGSYRDPNAGKTGYFDQTGTFKFEANVECRFPLVGIINGALFVDAGNVWLLKDDPSRPGGTLKGSTFLRDLALGTGFGLRVDLSMIVVRGDLGIGIHAPYDTGKSGYYNMRNFGSSLAFHLAIGYPF